MKAKLHLRSTSDGELIVSGVIPKSEAEREFGTQIIECFVGAEVEIKTPVSNNTKLAAYAVDLHPLL